MNFKVLYGLSYEECQRLLASHKYFNFTGEYDPTREYKTLDTFTKDGMVMICVSQYAIIAMNVFVRELQQYNLYNQFYQLGKQQLETVYKSINFPKEVLVEEADEVEIAEEVEPVAKALGSIKFICDVNVILRSTVFAINRFCQVNDMYLDINDGVHMTLANNEG